MHRSRKSQAEERSSMKAISSRVYIPDKMHIHNCQSFVGLFLWVIHDKKIFLRISKKHCSANISEKETSERRARSEVFLRSDFKANKGIYLRNVGNQTGNTTSGTCMLYNFHLLFYILSSNSEGLSGGGRGRKYDHKRTRHA